MVGSVAATLENEPLVRANLCHRVAFLRVRLHHAIQEGASQLAYAEDRLEVAIVVSHLFFTPGNAFAGVGDGFIKRGMGQGSSVSGLLLFAYEST